MYQEYAAKHATVRALEVMPVGSSDRLFVVDGVGVIDAATFGVLYAPAYPVSNRNGHAKRAPKAATKRNRRYARRQPLQEQVTEPIVSELVSQPARKPTLGDHIVASIQKHGPGTSGEIFDHVIKSGIATTSGSVYQCCRDLRDAGRIESHADDDGDGRMKWFVKG